MFLHEIKTFLRVPFDFVVFQFILTIATQFRCSERIHTDVILLLNGFKFVRLSINVTLQGKFFFYFLYFFGIS